MEFPPRFTVEVDGWRATYALQSVLEPAAPTVPAHRGLRVIDQRAAPHAWWQYAVKGDKTIADAGCYVVSLYALAVWAGWQATDISDPVKEFAMALDAAGCFIGNELLLPINVRKFMPSLLAWGRAHDFTRAPLDLQLLRSILDLYPVIIQVDFDPVTEAKIDPHFMLAYEYVPAADGFHDQLWVMDPWGGMFRDVAANHPEGYFGGTWKMGEAWCRQRNITAVQRVVTGIRHFVVM